MKTHLLSLLILISISTHLFAMDELFDTDQKQGIKDLFERVAEIPTKYKVAGFVALGGAATSLYKWDKRPVIISSAIVGGYLACKWLEDQEDDERSKRIDAIKEQYGIINSSINGITSDLTRIKSSVIAMNEKLETTVIKMETIQKDLEESTDEIKLTNACIERTVVILEDSIKTSNDINSGLAALIEEQKQLSALISKSHATINDDDNANADTILKALKGSFETNSLSITAKQ